MRVIAGTARSLQLKTPEGMDTRPTTDRIKETLFNMIQNDVPGGIFVDLFSGSGGIGIEALSRGAKKAYFVENDRHAIECIEANLKHTKLTENAMVLKQDAVTALQYSIHEPADVVFADPPYQKGYHRMLLMAAAGSKAVTEDTLLIIEETKDEDFSFCDELGFELIKEKIYKSNKHVFLRKKEMQ
ncbi:MAG: 16S rRNA (guanine(966)-N(2))-methyltransferase RsmD [Lachnospiraceae bacterium]|nr:16S rRNA (guanine(966)-N(2))-methyltransferase RsmD [Lachnospiraceae bacterium]